MNKGILGLILMALGAVMIPQSESLFCCFKSIVGVILFIIGLILLLESLSEFSYFKDYGWFGDTIGLILEVVFIVIIAPFYYSWKFINGISKRGRREFKYVKTARTNSLSKSAYTAGKLIKCSYCQSKIDQYQDVVACDGCKTTWHIACWATHKKDKPMSPCITFGCSTTFKLQTSMHFLKMYGWHLVQVADAYEGLYE